MKKYRGIIIKKKKRRNIPIERMRGVPIFDIHIFSMFYNRGPIHIHYGVYILDVV